MKVHGTGNIKIHPRAKDHKLFSEIDLKLALPVSYSAVIIHPEGRGRLKVGWFPHFNCLESEYQKKSDGHISRQPFATQELTP